MTGKILQSINEIQEDCWIREPDGNYYFYSVTGSNLPTITLPNPYSNQIEYEIINSNYFENLKRLGINFSPAYPYLEDIYTQHTSYLLLPESNDYRNSIHYRGDNIPIPLKNIHFMLWDANCEKHIEKKAPVYERVEHCYRKNGQTFSGSAPSDEMIKQALSICKQKLSKTSSEVSIKRPHSLPAHKINGFSERDY